MSFSKYIRDLRELKGLTQLQLAENLDISLINIKKIESGETKTPNSKLLDSLARFTKQEQVFVMREIFFNDNSDYTANPTNVLKSYVSYCYYNGWNFEMFPIFDSNLVGRRMYDCLLTKKRDAPNKVLVQELGSFMRILDISKNYDKTVLFFIDRVKDLKYMKEINKIRSFTFVLDSQKTNDVEVYNNIKKYDLSMFSLKLDVVLFDSKDISIVDSFSL